ncbi:efflux RND transporter permease subunit [Rhodohalobacter mucosus]|uniref:Transporter n=1 Tax=Rhodohalobacter mucosus TaxID=2079485 RepID=A0A316TPK6_9BACT|nr:MMPL family transporter [Rhodohalobacter mucosus]PWN06537.1 transporter [Rhodohalobacter mucosus]
MFDKLFHNENPIIRFCLRNPGTVVLAGVLLAAAGLYLALNLRIDTDYSKLIPEEYPSVQSLERLREQVGATNEAAVILQGSSFDQKRAFAVQLIPEAMALTERGSDTPYFSRYEFRKETEFLKSHALWLATDNELRIIEEYLEEKTELARLQANPFYFELEDDSDRADSLGSEIEKTYEDLIGSEYPVSEDSLNMAVRFYPIGPQTDVEYIRELYEDLDKVTSSLMARFGDEDLRYLLAGRLLRNLVEIDAIYSDVRQSFAAGSMMLMMLVLFYFFYRNMRLRTPQRALSRQFAISLARMPATAVIIFLPLVLSLCWTFGVAWLTIGTLNIMTSTLILLLFGMGIDFGIHFFARFSEEREAGKPTPEAILITFRTTGRAIAAVGITTAAGFFILMLADFRGFSEFGAISGIGILFSIAAMNFLLPSLILTLEKSHLLPDLYSGGVPHRLKKLSENGLQKKNGTMTLAATGILSLAVVAASLSLWFAPGVGFEYDFGKLHPEYESYNRVAREAHKVYSDRKTRNAAYIVAESPHHAIELSRVLRERMKADTISPTIQSVEVLQDRYPFTESGQKEKRRRIQNIRDMLKDPFLSRSDTEHYRQLQRAASSEELPPLREIPDFILEPFTSADGTIGNLVIIYPGVGLSDGRNSMDFADDLSGITLNDGTVYHAASTSIVASDMLRLMIEEAPRMIALTLTFIILVKLIIFRSFLWMAIALIPLITGFLWLFGVMELAGWKLNFYNIVVMPTLLGIGDDSGIHLVHRYLEEGRGSILKVVRSTGEHVTVSALTTMLGFAGLLFSSHPGMRTIGELAVTGIGLLLLASLVVLPSALQVLEAITGGHGGSTPQPVEKKREEPIESK